MTVEKWLEGAEKHGEYHADLKVAIQIIRRSREALEWVGLADTLAEATGIAREAKADCDAIVEGK